MMELPHLEKKPFIPEGCYIDPSARINGDVAMGEECSVWFQVSIRGDVNWIRIGERTNIQDNCVLHNSHRADPLEIGSNVTLGHSVIAHGCKIGNSVLIGMQSLIMDGAEVGDHVLLGASSLVTEGKKIPSGVLAFGRPAKIIRDLNTEELKMIEKRALHYRDCAAAYKTTGCFKRWEDNFFH